MSPVPGQFLDMGLDSRLWISQMTALTFEATACGTRRTWDAQGRRQNSPPLQTSTQNIEG